MRDSPSQYFVQLREALSLLLEPIGSKAPAFSGEAKISLLSRRIGREVSISCNAQEPVGSKAPAFAGDTKLSLLIRRVNLDIGLLCNVQGHPPPKARTLEGHEFEM
ncbi:hypothetical protein M0804_000251 [Polistes exclamans]|nr:hypothetical protein M0804_000251 [Polistes exclamans]